MQLPVALDPGGTAAVLADLSVGGAFIESATIPAFGVELTIVVDLPGLAAARIPATVRWAKPGGFGVQFGLLGAQVTHAVGRALQAARG